MSLDIADLLDSKDEGVSGGGNTQNNFRQLRQLPHKMVVFDLLAQPSSWVVPVEYLFPCIECDLRIDDISYCCFPLVSRII
jgi:hypothetical protein